MTLTDPAPLTDIIDHLGERTPIGAALRTADWERVPQGLRDRAVFTASVESLRFVSRIGEGVNEIVQRARSVNADGKEYWTTDRSKLVAQLRKLGREVGVEHPDDPGRKAEGGRRKVNEADITDPLSIRRLKLIVDTQLEMAHGYGNFLSAHDPAVLDVWPCWELVRISPRAVPRDWRRRWMEAGGTLHDGRMIARKDSGIWSAISRFGNPYPPFDFNSGMGVEEIRRDEAEALGVIAPDDQVVSQVEPFNAGLQASMKDLPPGMARWLKKAFGDQIEIDEGTVKWAERPVGRRQVKPVAAPPGTDEYEAQHGQQTASSPAPPPLPLEPGDRSDGGGEGDDAPAIRELAEAVFRGALGESYPELHHPGGGFQKGVECHIAAAALGRKPVYFDPWGDALSKNIASGLRAVLPPGARVESRGGNLYVFTEAAARKVLGMVDGDPFDAIHSATLAGENGFLLGYGAPNTEERPAALVTLADVQAKLFVKFYTRHVNLQTSVRERLLDLMQALPEMEFVWSHEIKVEE